MEYRVPAGPGEAERREKGSRFLAIVAPYARLGDVKRLVHPPAVELVSEEYGEESRLILRVLLERQPMLEEMLADLGLAPEAV